MIDDAKPGPCTMDVPRGREVLDCCDHLVGWADSFGCDCQPGKCNRVLAELEFVFVYGDAIFCTYGEVVEYRVERCLNVFAVEQGVIYTFHLVWYVFYNVVITTVTRLGMRNTPVGVFCSGIGPTRL